MAGTERVKILGICGSARHASTEWGVKLALSAAESLGFADTEFVNLGDYRLEPCTGCMKCFGWQHPADAPTPYCYDTDDDSGLLLAKMMESDGFLVGSPVYVMGVTGLTRILQEKAHQFGPMSNTKFAGLLRGRPMGAITVGGATIGGQEACAQSIWIWGIGIGLQPVGAWPTQEDPNPQASGIAAMLSTSDSRSIYAKEALSKSMTRTVPPTQGWKNEKSLRNIGRHVAHAAMVAKLGRRAFDEAGYPAPITITPWPRYSVKPKPGSWVAKLIEDGIVQFAPKGEFPEGKNPWEEDDTSPAR